MFPFSLSNFALSVKEPYFTKFEKDSLVDIAAQLIGIHLPVWLSVIALNITLVEIFSMHFRKFFFFQLVGLELSGDKCKYSFGLKKLHYLNGIFKNEIIFLDHHFYYHSSTVKLFILIISVFMGLFHEIHWTWIVNNILGISTTYLLIARVQANFFF